VTLALLLLLLPGCQVDFMIDEALPRMVAWGLLQQQQQGQGQARYSLVPLPQALANLQAYWQRMQQQQTAAGGDPSDRAAATDQQRYSLLAEPPAAAVAAANGSVQASLSGAAGRMLVGSVPGWRSDCSAGGGCAASIGGRVVRRMPLQQVQQARRVVPCRMARGARATAAAAAARVRCRQGLAAAGRGGCWATA
jgi:hypothetical protein